MKKYKGYLYHTITRDDVISPFESMGVEKFLRIKQCMGDIQTCDIGKQVYIDNGICSVENAEQMKERLKASL